MTAGELVSRLRYPLLITRREVHPDDYVLEEYSTRMIMALAALLIEKHCGAEEEIVLGGNVDVHAEPAGDTCSQD